MSSATSGTVTQSTAVMDDAIWQDRDLRFDLPQQHFQPRRTETLIDTIDSIEDTKAANNERGTLTVTNLRLTWQSDKSGAAGGGSGGGVGGSGGGGSNLSIGWNCVVGVTIKSVENRLKGKSTGLYITTKHNNQRFEFVFTHVASTVPLALSTTGKPQPSDKSQSANNGVPLLFNTVQQVYKSYDNTKLYRDLKLRGAIIKDKTLILLPQENVYSKIEGVWNLSSDQGNLGSFFITNVRLVWHANLAENFNVSIPYMQIKVVKVRDSKFGHALVIETMARSGGYVLGFRIDPMDTLLNVFQEIKTLHSVYAVTPIWGVVFDQNKSNQAVTDGNENGNSKKKEATIVVNEDVEIVDNAHVYVLASYLADGSSGGSGSGSGSGGSSGGDGGVGVELVYDKVLGLAVEKLRDPKISMKELWSVA